MKRNGDWMLGFEWRELVIHEEDTKRTMKDDVGGFSLQLHHFFYEDRCCGRKHKGKSLDHHVHLTWAIGQPSEFSLSTTVSSGDGHRDS